MSQPISLCMISKAVTDPKALEDLIQAMRVNKRYGHWTQFGCRCTPPCRRPTQEELDALNKKIAEATKDIVCEAYQTGHTGMVGKASTKEDHL